MLVACAAALALGACADNRGVELSVDLKTDLIPGVEFYGVRTSVTAIGEDGMLMGATRSADALAMRGVDFFRGRRVAEVGDMSVGDYLVHVALVRQGGAVVVERSVRVRVVESVALTVVITRSCRSVLCPRPTDDPAATTCVGGECVDPRCGSGLPDACPEPECERDDQCVPTSPCATGSCADGVCVFDTRGARCPAGEYCDPELGCRLLPSEDAGTGPELDGGRDGGGPDGEVPVDAEVDGGIDVDAGRTGPAPPTVITQSGGGGRSSSASLSLEMCIGAPVAGGAVTDRLSFGLMTTAVIP